MEDKSGIYRDVFAKVEGRKVTRLYPVDYYEAVYTRQAKMLVNSICEDLEKRGYEVQTFAVPAASVGAPHRRERIWFIAHRTNANTGREFGIGRQSEQSGESVNNGSAYQRPEKADERKGLFETWPDTETQSEWVGLKDLFKSPGEDISSDTIGDVGSGCGYGETGCPQNKSKSDRQERQRVRPKSERIGSEGNVTDSEVIGQERNGGSRRRGNGSENGHSNGDDEYTDSPRRGQQLPTEITTESRFSCGRHIENWDNWPTQSPVCSGDDGLPTELDGITFSSWRNESIKSAGNAVVPQVVLEFFKLINLIHDKRQTHI
jgi:DNA (cytosine-5)-methyltransferase 1